MRFNGRFGNKQRELEEEYHQGWNMYMTPEQAARGLTLMVSLPEHNRDIACWFDYPDLSHKRIFN